mmetsp:Transcript_29803/g.49419  ORF Transcript_29803/g.49419 Transcript_29803/m.49419 type:complete len:188 (+) Transcript_29803:184-747(+)
MPPLSFPSVLAADDSSLSDGSVFSEKTFYIPCCSRRSVSFSPVVEVHPTLHRQDMSAEEIQSVWVNRYERRETRKVADNTAYLMKSGVGCMLSDEDYFCPRGLEHLYEESTDYDLEVKKSKKIALAMQRVLRRAGANSPEMIARAYRKYTLRSRRNAYQKALGDQAAVTESSFTGAERPSDEKFASK